MIASVPVPPGFTGSEFQSGDERGEGATVATAGAVSGSAPIVWIPRGGEPRAGGVAVRRLVCHVVQPRTNCADPVARLRAAWIGKIYVNYLKQIPAIRRSVRWTYRHGYPLYIKYVPWLLWKVHRKKALRWRTLVPYSDVAKRQDSETYLLADSGAVRTPMPRVSPAADRRYLQAPNEQYVFPAMQVTTVRDAVIYGGTNLILAGDEVICHDLYDFKRDYTSEELHGRTQIRPGSGRIRWLLHDENPESIPVAAAFVDACAANYAHWVTEVLPRIAVFCADDRFNHAPIVIDDGLHQNLVESLFLVVGPQPEVIALPIGRALAVEKLFLTSVAGYVPFERRTRRLSGHSHGLFCPVAFATLRQRLATLREERGTEAWPERIYLRRNSGLRRLVNVDELEPLLASRGYVVVETERLTFSQQVSLFANVERVFAPTGAACANMVFCRPGTRFGIMMARHQNMPYRYWANMAAAIGVDVSYVLGDMVGGRGLGHHGDFRVDPDDVRNVLDWMERA